MPEPAFPPPGYYWSLASPVTTRDRSGEAPILNSQIVVRDGVGYLRYQLPQAPVEDVVRIDGYLVSTPAGDLIDKNDVVVGTINFDTGVFEINASLSPDFGARRVSYVFPRAPMPLPGC